MVSICMASYNGERFIREQMDSILRQTYQDFEVVICDDCSRDGTLSILQEYAQRDSRIHIYKNEHNLGLVKNFEQAIGLSKGEFVALCDQDDIWTDDHLQYLLDNIGDYDIACGNAELINADGTPKHMLLNVAESFYVKYENELFLYRHLCMGNPLQGNSMLIKRSFLNSGKVLPIADGIGFQDAYFSMCATLMNGISYSFDKVVNYYRMHEHNASGSKKKLNVFRTLFKVISRKIKKEEYTTDRLDYIKAIRERFNLTERQKQVIDECEQIITSRMSRNIIVKLKGAKLFYKRYKYIMAFKTNHLRLLATIRTLLY